jgi:hypothetical protein
MAHIRQSRPDSGLGFQVRDLKIVQDVPSSLRHSRGADESLQDGDLRVSLVQPRMGG